MSSKGYHHIGMNGSQQQLTEEAPAPGRLRRGRVRTSLLALALSLACALTASAAEHPPPEKTPPPKPEAAFPFARPATPQQAEQLATLIKQLGDDKWPQREAAAKTLAQLGEVAIPGLLGAARSEDEEVSYRAAELLRKLLPKARISRLLHDSMRRHRVSGEEAVKRMGGQERAAAALVKFLKLAGGGGSTRSQAVLLLGYCGAPALEALTGYLDSADTGMRGVAVTALGQIGPGAAGALPALLELVSDGNSSVRENLAVALGRIGAGVQGAPPLVKLLADKESRVRRRAAEALGKLGPPVKEAAVPALEKALGNADAWTRRAAALALHQVGGAEALGKVIPALTGFLEGGDIKLRVAAVATLGEMGAAAGPALPALVKALKHDSRDSKGAVPKAVLAALEKMGPAAAEAVPALVAILEAPPRKRGRGISIPAVLATLGRLGPVAKAALPTLQKLVDAGHPNYSYVRVPALVAQMRITGRTGDGVKVLIESLPSQNWKISQYAAQALGDIGPEAKAAIPALEKMLEDRKSKYAKYRRRAAAAALKKIRPLEQKPAEK